MTWSSTSLNEWSTELRPQTIVPPKKGGSEQGPPITLRENDKAGHLKIKQSNQRQDCEWNKIGILLVLGKTLNCPRPDIPLRGDTLKVKEY